MLLENQDAMAYNKAWIVDHGPVRLHRNEPQDILPPQPNSRVRRKVDQFRTMASRAASRFGHLRERIGNDIKTKTMRRKQPVPQSPRRKFSSYGQEDIFINPFGATIKPEKNFASQPGPGMMGGRGGMGGGFAMPRADDTYEKIDDAHVKPSLSDLAMNMMGVQPRDLLDESAGSSDEGEGEYEPEPRADFKASELTTNYEALYYLARTRRFELFSPMWRHYRDHHTQGDILHQAARRGHHQLIEALLERNIDVNKVDAAQTTPLYLAIENGNTECARLLINKGAVAEVSENVEPGKSVIHTAARKGNLKVIQQLVKVDRWVDVNAVGEFDYTPLHVAADAGHADVIQFLLDSGASIDALTQSDRTAFEIAMHNDKLDIAKLLIDRGANIERFDGYGRSILHWAAGSSSPHIVRFLLDASASPRLANKDGTMPHHVAARHGRAANLHVLLERGAPLDATRSGEPGPTAGSRMALLDALEAKKYACVAILIIHGAKTHALGEDPTVLLLRLANTFAHEPSHFGGQLIEGFLYSGHILNIPRAIREVYRKMNLYADLEAWYRQLLPRPSTLKNLCRVHIRRVLVKKAFGTSILADVGKLELPSNLQDFLLIKECDLQCDIGMADKSL